jgi:hypothetical protein
MVWSVLELLEKELAGGIFGNFFTLRHAEVAQMLGLVLHVLL